MVIWFRYLLFAVLSLAVVYIGCSDNLSNLPQMPPRDQFEIAKGLFHEGDYDSSKLIFDRLTRLNIIADFSDSAQYMLAESHFALRDFILAAAEYIRLTTNLPGSPLVKAAKFKIGECYSQLSPKQSLDQEYTRRAIQSFQDFAFDFPTDTVFTPLAIKKINELALKLARKDFNNALSYYKEKSYGAAIIYFDDVISNYPGNELTQEAVYYKAECFYNMNKLDEAKKQFQLFVELNPNHRFAEKSRNRLAQIAAVPPDTTAVIPDTTTFR